MCNVKLDEMRRELLFLKEKNKALEEEKNTLAQQVSHQFGQLQKNEALASVVRDTVKKKLFPKLKFIRTQDEFDCLSTEEDEFSIGLTLMQEMKVDGDSKYKKNGGKRTRWMYTML